MTKPADGATPGTAAPETRMSAFLAKLRLWRARILTRAFWTGAMSAAPRKMWPATTSMLAVLYTLAVRLPWVLAVIVITTIVVQGLTQHTTVVKPISVPKALADSGYTPDVAGQRLRDAILSFTNSIPTRRKNPEIALSGDLPNIVVPTVGISLDAIVSSIRTLLRSTRSRTISGEITTTKDDLLWLHLRIDGRKLYSSEKGVNPDKPDELFAAAVRDVMKEIGPYFVAVAVSHEDIGLGMRMINDLLLQPTADDENTAWLYNLKGSLFLQQKNYAEATNALNKALQLTNNRLVGAHLNLALIHRNQNHDDLAMAEYRLAMQYGPREWAPHNDMGVMLSHQGKRDEAMAQYAIAAALDPKAALPHNNLGVIYRAQGKNDDAIVEYRKAIEADAKQMLAHRNLGNALAAENKSDEAIAEYRKAIELDPKDSFAPGFLGDLYKRLGRREEAIAAYRDVLKIDPQAAAVEKNMNELLAQNAVGPSAVNSALPQTRP